MQRDPGFLMQQQQQRKTQRRWHVLAALLAALSAAPLAQAQFGRSESPLSLSF
jgi:hypothetical protein